MIEIPNLIVYTSIFVWLLPPIKQFRTEYFYFFLILAILDPVKILFFLTGDYSPVDISFPFLILLVFSIFHTWFKKYFLALIILAIIISFFGKNLSMTADYSIKVVVYTFILVVFLLRMSRFLIQSGNINLYYVVLILYVLSIILKYITLIFDLKTGVINFYLTSAFEIIIAFFFIFFNVNNEKIHFTVKLKSTSE